MRVSNEIHNMNGWCREYSIIYNLLLPPPYNIFVFKNNHGTIELLGVDTRDQFSSFSIDPPHVCTNTDARISP